MGSAFVPSLLAWTQVYRPFGLYINCAHPSAKLARWALIVQELDLEIKHRSGKSNANADALSRNPTDADAHPVLEVTVATDSVLDGLNSMSDLSAQQRQDPELLALIKYIEDDVLPEDEHQARRIVLERPNFTVSDGVLQYENPQEPGALTFYSCLTVINTRLSSWTTLQSGLKYLRQRTRAQPP